jgi:hypothetical protein
MTGDLSFSPHMTKAALIDKVSISQGIYGHINMFRLRLGSKYVGCDKNARPIFDLLVLK